MLTKVTKLAECSWKINDHPYNHYKYKEYFNIIAITPIFSVFLMLTSFSLASWASLEQVKRVFIQKQVCHTMTFWLICSILIWQLYVCVSSGKVFKDEWVLYHIMWPQHGMTIIFVHMTVTDCTAFSIIWSQCWNSGTNVELSTSMFHHHFLRLD